MIKAINHGFLDAVCREPYRLFFPLGVVMGIAGIIPWLLYALRLIPGYVGFVHSSTQMLVYMNCFIIGFLLTFIPRFTGTAYASRCEILAFFVLFVGMMILLERQAWGFVQMLYLVWLGLLVAFLARRVLTRRSSTGKPPLELLWLPLGIFHAFVGTVILLLVEGRLAPLWMAKVGKPMMEQGFLLSLVLGIGGFLIPRILGTYESPSSGGCCESCTCSAPKMSPTKKAAIFHLTCAGLVFISFWLKGLEMLGVSYLLQAFVVTAEFFWTKTLPRYPRGVGFYGKMAWLSCWMIVVGFWGAAVFPKYNVEMLHIVFIGGFSVMTFAVATMVIFSHSGQAEQLKKPMWVLWVVLAAVLLAVIKRFAVVFFPDHFFKFLGMASILWIIGALSWLVFILPKIFFVPTQDEFSKMHEEAKQRLNR